MSKVTWKAGNFLYPLPAVMVSCGTMEKSNIITVAWTGILNTNPAKGMKYTDKARSKEFGFVIFMEHMCNNTINSREKTVQKRAVI